MRNIARNGLLVRELAEENARLERYDHLLRRLLLSRASTLAERVSRLRLRAGRATDEQIIAKDQI